MASVTNIKSIANSSLSAVVITTLDGNKQILSIGAGGVWNGDLWVPWVGEDQEMNKCLVLTMGDKQRRIYQDYWNPPNENAVKWVHGNETYDQGKEVMGDNRGGGDKALIINNDGTLRLQSNQG